MHISNKSRTFAYRKREVFLIKSGAFQEQKVEPIKTLKIMNTTTSVENKKKFFESLIAEAEKNIKYVLSVCPSWELKYVNPGYKRLTIKLTLKGSEGFNLDITYRKKSCFQDEGLFTNVCARGDFNMIEPNDNLKYYSAVGSLLSNREMLAALNNTMQSCEAKFEEFDD